MPYYMLDAMASLLANKTTVIIGALVCYIVLCRSLRYLRRNTRHASSPYKTREDFKKMTAEDAFEIAYYVQGLEFPWTTGKALSFVLFRTYGIPSMSKLLIKTQQLSNVEHAGRRFSDTVVLIVEMLAHSPSSERVCSAIARMNYLHGRYQKADKISNDDLLYTLSLFVLEVERWVRLYDWRALTPLEMCAFGTHWKAIGDAMGIDYSPLRPSHLSFTDGLDFFDAVREWSEAYEQQCMVPDPSNHQLAEETIRILLTDIPGPLKPFVKRLITALMGERLCHAMLYASPPPIYHTILTHIFTIRKFLLRNFFLPRPWFLRYTIVSENPDPITGRYHLSEYESEPWYVKPTFFARHSPLSWFRWVIGGSYPGDGRQYKPEGYKIFEVGPKKLEGKGVEVCAGMRDRLLGSGRGGCPFKG